MKNKRLFVAASFALLLVVSTPSARADGADQPWDGPNKAPLDFATCLYQSGLTALDIATSAL